MKTSKIGLEFIEKWEGCILKPYRCVAGLRTIGIGHVILPHENFPDGATITREKAIELLSIDLEKCETALLAAVKVPLNQNQFDALISFGFNCGVGVYRTSTACKLLNSGDYASVPKKLLDWSKATVGGKKQTVPGLLARRKAEGELFSCLVGDVANEVPQTVTWNSNNLADAQGKLKKLGLYGGKVDGIWGPRTSAAVETFANVRGIEIGSSPSVAVPKALIDALNASV